MQFNSSEEDKNKWKEFHLSEFVHKQVQLKSMMQADLIKAIDELNEVVVSNERRIEWLNQSFKTTSSEDRQQQCKQGIEKYKNLSILANKVSEIYLMLLDIYTYGTYCMLAEDEWDWRAFARHLCTILYEHPSTVNKQLNDIIKILKADLENVYDITSLVQAKKDFSSFINEKSAFAKRIRINVDAHFDGDFEKRLSLIKDLSYSEFIELYYNYLNTMHNFLSKLKPALQALRRTADITYCGIIYR